MKGKKKRPIRSGVLLVDKPGGQTSHDVIRDVRRIFGQREVGHTGTLDPMATGLMVVLLGRATRLARFVEATKKAYVGTVTLGRATTTYDAEGEVTEEAPIDGITEDRIEAALGSLVGEIDQAVPAFSAVKVGGERLYQKARRGEAVETPVRRVTIERLASTRIGLPEIDIEVVCSKGTYIRTLAVQIGAALGVPAHLSSLRRTGVGRFSISEALRLEGMAGSTEALRPIQAAVADLPSLVLANGEADDVRHGRPLTVATIGGLIRAEALPAGAPVAVFDAAGELLAIAETKLSVEGLAGAEKSDRAVGYACVLSSR